VRAITKRWYAKFTSRILDDLAACQGLVERWRLVCQVASGQASGRRLQRGVRFRGIVSAFVGIRSTDDFSDLCTYSADKCE